MSSNPHEHDLDELRKMARVRGAGAGGPRPAEPGEPWEADIEPPREPDTEPPRAADTEPPREADTEPPREADTEPPREADTEPPREADAGFQAPGPGVAGDGDTRSTNRAGLYRELLSLEGTATAEKPYLRRLPETYVGELLVFEWIDHLRSPGYRAAAESLAYYESIGWITAEVRSELDEYARGLDEATAADDGLDVDDHMQTLVYVAELASVENSP